MKKIRIIALYITLMCCFIASFGITAFADYKYAPIEDCIEAVKRIESCGDDYILSESDIAAIERVLEYDKEKMTTGTQNVQKITLDKKHFVMAVGDTSEALIAELEPKNGLGGRLTWYTSDPSVITVDPSGKVTAVGEGHAAVFAVSENGYSPVCGIYVMRYTEPKERLEVCPLKDVCEVGSEVRVCNHYNGYFSSDNSVTMSVSDPDILEFCGNDYEIIGLSEERFNCNGINYIYLYTINTCKGISVYKALKPGEVVITSKTQNGLEKSITVTVKPKDTGVDLSDSSIELEAGESRKVSATVTPADAYNTTVTWESGDTSVAAVDADGNITAVGVGTTTITATSYNGHTSTCTVTVTDLPEPTSISISPSSVIIPSGQTRQLSLTVLPEDANTKNITWSSDNASVAAVDENGVVTAVSEGTATITASTKNGTTAVCKITVSDKAIATSIQSYLDGTTVYFGSNYQIYTSITPTNAQVDLKYSASNDRVTISDSGVITPVSRGRVVITVTDTISNKTSTITTYVTDAPTKVTAINTQTNAMEIKVGDSQTIMYSLLPVGVQTDVTITCNSPCISIDNNVVTGLAEGKAIVEISAGGKTKSFYVTVHPADSYDVSEFKLNKTVYNTKVGEIFNIDYSSDISVKMFGLNWQSSNFDIAIVNQYGTVTAKKAGHVQISVACGNIEPQVCDIFITEADEAEDLSEMTINFAIRTLNLTVGDKLSFSDLGYTVEPEEYADKVKVVSMNPQLIEISNNTIIAKAYGQADIRIYVPNGQNFNITTYIQKNEADAAADQLSFAEEILACLNVERAKYDLAPLTLDNDLSALAQIRAEECKISYSHTRPDGTKWSTIFANTAYAKKYCGENLIRTAGYSNAQELVDIWMSSPSHASNILNPRFNYVGVGAILGINTSSTEKIAYISALLFVAN